MKMRIVINKKPIMPTTTLRTVFSITGLVASFYCVISAINKHGIIGPVFLLPCMYTLLIWLLPNCNDIRLPGRLTFNMVIFGRYVILPVVYYANQKMSRFALNYDYMTYAVVLMLYEMFALFIVLNRTGYRCKLKIEKYENNNIDHGFIYMRLKYGPIIAMLIIAILGVLLYRNQSLVGGINLLSRNNLAEEVDPASNFVNVVWATLVVWVYVYFVMQCHERYLKRKNKKYFTYSLLLTIAIIIVSFISQTTISRWYTVVTTVTSLYLIMKLYPGNKRSVFLYVVVPAVILIFIASIYKNTYYLTTQESNLRTSFFELIDPTTVDTYFGGPVGVNNAIGTKISNSSIGLHSIVYDLTKNFPVLNRYIDVEKSVADAYTNYIHRYDQIIPLIGQSSIFFGYLLSPILTCISIYIFTKTDFIFYTNRKASAYMYAFISVWFALEIILNLKINASWMYNKVFPFAVIFWVTDRMSAVEQSDTSLS